MSVPGQDTGAQPSLIGGHLQYVKGATEETIGSLTGSKEWTQSGEHDKAQGRQTMEDASAYRDPQTHGKGSVEEFAGKITGCEGMEKEGRESKTKNE